jgi:hypothetical protein
LSKVRVSRKGDLNDDCCNKESARPEYSICRSSSFDCKREVDVLFWWGVFGCEFLSTKVPCHRHKRFIRMGDILKQAHDFCEIGEADEGQTKRASVCLPSPHCDCHRIQKGQKSLPAWGCSVIVLIFVCYPTARKEKRSNRTFKAEYLYNPMTHVLLPETKFSH